MFVTGMTPVMRKVAEESAAAHVALQSIAAAMMATMRMDPSTSLTRFGARRRHFSMSRRDEGGDAFEIVGRRDAVELARHGILETIRRAPHGVVNRRALEADAGFPVRGAM